MPSGRGLWIGVAAAVALLAGVGAAFMLRGGPEGGALSAAGEPATAATGAVPVAAAPAPAGPSTEELQTQIDQMIADRLAASQENLKKTYDEQLRTLQRQLDEAKRAGAERQAAARSAPPPEPPRPAPAEPASPPAAADPEPEPAPAAPPATTAASEPEPVPAAPPETAPANPPAPPVESAPEPAAAPPPAVAATDGARVGELVQPGAGVVRPSLVRRPAPRYPEIARRTKREATVAVTVLVDENGRVQDARIKGAKAGYGFDEAAMDAARRATFNPATKNGVRVRMWYDMNISFKPQ